MLRLTTVVRQSMFDCASLRRTTPHHAGLELASLRRATPHHVELVCLAAFVALGGCSEAVHDLGLGSNAGGGGASAGSGGLAGAPADSLGSAGHAGTPEGAATGGSDEGATTASPYPKGALVACDSERTELGGELYTFTDVLDNTYATAYSYPGWEDETQSDGLFKVTPSPDSFDDANNSCKITGKMPQNPTGHDLQIDMEDACGDRPLYPAAGFGFGFQDGYSAFSVCETLGVRFRARGTFFDLEEEVASVLSVRVQFPTIETSLWQPGEAWADNSRGKICTCSSDLPGNTDELKTCGGYYGREVTVTPEWEWYTVAWGDLIQPSWAGLAAFDPTHLLKMEWSIESRGEYELEVDDVQFILAGDALGGNWCEADLELGPLASTDPTFCDLVEDDPFCSGAEPTHYE